AEALDLANAAADELGSTLKNALVSKMKAEGPLAAATVCSQSAESLTADIATRTGAAVGRSSLRLRNAKNAAPPWVKQWLSAQGERPAEGAKGISRSLSYEGTTYAQVLRPLAVAGPCLVCHGPKESIAPEIASLLAEKYPDDAATGYALGDLRGALYSEVQMADPSR
ncbi:MAG: DUF3365 domain-containing protein, partial [Deltaproteobacteria bacterium]|nr:DUF3365 domain-containing protein [Deltaproteobacteria bacterium]